MKRGDDMMQIELIDDAAGFDCNDCMNCIICDEIASIDAFDQNEAFALFD